ncbi:hypothetical protein BGZ99_005557 [Dissophora globulifera]|uniref:Uncharacterized protein n=1 Tax=Dissophora globulifera TaxID=979702 RepID=A0A9P6REY8_9FUNG|nr:hypothetical protein BGZ99_005557 [Dissophora globulifera]
MADNIHHLNDDQFRYFGVTTQLDKEMLYGKTSFDEESTDQALDDYFFDTPQKEMTANNSSQKKSTNSPFEKDSLDDGGLKDEKDEDAVTVVQERSHHPLNMAFRKAERNVDSNQARKPLKQRIVQEKNSPLKDLYEYAAKLPKDCQPASEADQTSSFSKRILDELVTRMEITEEAQVLFFQVIGKKCTFYIMRRSETVCVAVEMAKIKFAYTISDVLVGFEEDVRRWLLVDRTFQNHSSVSNATKVK